MHEAELPYQELQFLPTHALLGDWYVQEVPEFLELALWDGYCTRLSVNDPPKDLLETLPPPPPPHTPRRASPILTAIWMTSSPRCRGGAERQHRFFNSTVHALKWLFPLLPGIAKDSVLVKKLLAGEGGW